MPKGAEQSGKNTELAYVPQLTVSETSMWLGILVKEFGWVP